MNMLFIKPEDLEIGDLFNPSSLGGSEYPNKTMVMASLSMNDFGTCYTVTFKDVYERLEIQIHANSKIIVGRTVKSGW